MKAYIYARFSTAEQARGSSLERQLRDCRAFSDRQGWLRSEARELVDEGRSAYDGSNRAAGSALAEFERAAREGELPPGTVLVVERLDRLSRQDPVDVFGLVASFVEAGVAIATVHPESIIQTKMSFEQLISTIVTAKLANEESEKKSDRLRAAWEGKRKRAAEGMPLTAMCPAWLCVDKDAKIYVVQEDRAAVVREIFQMAASGQGRGLIASQLNERNVPTFTPRAAGWHPSYVQKILGSRAVLGEFQPGRMVNGSRVPAGDVLPEYFPAIIDHDLFARAQAARAQRRSMAGRRGPRIANLLAGLAKCHACGSTMTFRDKGKATERYLVCDGALRRRGCNNRAHFNYPHVERAILDELLALALDDRQLSMNDGTATLLVEQASTKDAISSIEVRRARLIDLLSRGTDDAAEGLYRELGAELAELRQVADRIENALVVARGLVAPDELLARVRAVRHRIESADADIVLPARAMTQQALRGLIDKVTCDGVNRHVTVVVLGGVAVFRIGPGGELIARSSDLRQLAAVPDMFREQVLDCRADRLSAFNTAVSRVPTIGVKRGVREGTLAEHALDVHERDAVR